MDRVEDVGLNRRGFLKFLSICAAASASVKVPEAFADLSRDVDSIRRHPMVKINLRDGGERFFNLDVDDVSLTVDLESYWGGSIFNMRDGGGRSRLLSSPTYCLDLKDGPSYLTCRPVDFIYENDDPEEFYTIVFHEAVEQHPGQNHRRVDAIGGDSFFIRERDD